MGAQTAKEAFDSHLPLRIHEVQWNDPTLSLIGDGWSFTVTAPWRVTGPDGFEYSWSSAAVEDRVWDLVGADVVGVEPQTRSALNDPRLALSGGYVLEVFSDASADTWTLHLPGTTFVGPLTDSDWSG